eukprot:6435465-Pyramimonas_sp.AAC.1
MYGAKATAPTGPLLGVGDSSKLRGQIIFVGGTRVDADGYCGYVGSHAPRGHALLSSGSRPSGRKRAPTFGWR